MNEEKNFNFKKFKLPKIGKPNLTKKKIIILSAVVAGIAGASFGYNALFSKDETESINTATVTKGDLTVSIEGSGAIEAMEMYEIYHHWQREIFCSLILRKARKLKKEIFFM